MIAPDDPRLTAYLVDDVDPETTAAVEEALQDSPAAREAAAEILETAGLLAEALRAESVPALHPAQRAAIAQASRARRAGASRAAFWAGLAAALAAAVSVLLWNASGRDVPRQVSSADDLPSPAPPAAVAPDRPEPAASVSPAQTVGADLTPAQEGARESAAASLSREPSAAPSAEPARLPSPEAAPAPMPVHPLATIRGVVRDQSGSPIPGATIVARSRTTGATVSATTNPQGEFVLNGRLAGALEMQAELPGFATVRGEISAPAMAVVSWEPVLRVGAMAEAVVVAEDYSAMTLNRVTGGVVGGVVGGRLGGLPDRPTESDFGGERGFNTESYAYRADSDFVEVVRHPLSTFSVDVDTASYANVRRFLNEGRLPPPDAVRIEELVNYFPYEYRPPPSDPLAAHVEQAPAPWAPRNRLVRIGLKAREIAEEARPASNLVFLVDVSGSMNQPNKLPLVKRALEMLVERLDARDRVAVVVYAGAAGLVLPSTSGADTATILRALDRLQAGGSTNGAQGIQLAYDTAAQGLLPGGNNRVILATDGDFNVGMTDQGSLTRLIQERAKEGVFLSVLGFGMGNYKDSTLELLADKGNGNYAYVDTEREARKALVEELTSTLFTVAKDVKVQVEFNPAKVRSYRLLGYENRLLRPEEFQDDRKDAGEVGAGHAVTALYEIVPAQDVTTLRAPEPPLRYLEPGQLKPEARGNELMRLRIRYKEPDGETSRLREWPVSDRPTSLRRTSADFRFAAAVAAFGMVLRDSPYAGRMTLEDVFALAAEARGPDPGGYRAEFLELIGKARTLHHGGQRR